MKCRHHAVAFFNGSKDFVVPRSIAPNFSFLCACVSVCVCVCGGGGALVATRARSNHECEWVFQNETRRLWATTIQYICYALRYFETGVNTSIINYFQHINIIGQ